MWNLSISHCARGIALMLAAYSAIAGATAMATNLVTNGDFGTGDYTGWTLANPPGQGYGFYTLAVPGPSYSDPFSGTTINAYSGNIALYGFGGADGSLSQSIATIPGDIYKVSFAYVAENGGPTNDFTAKFGSTTMFTITNDTSQGSSNPINMTLQTYLETATSSSTVISFSGRNDNLYDALGSVSVTFFAPEPSSIALLSVAAVGLALAARRRKVASI